MKIAAVIGWPIHHSLSPAIHNYWLKKHNIAGEYKKYAINPSELEHFLQYTAPKMAGFNVTIPFKEKLYDYIKQHFGNDHITPLAQEIGAINTVEVRGNKLYGDNSDAFGFWANIESQVKDYSSALVIGAGGASRAVIVALKHAGFKDITVVNRTLERAQQLGQEFNCKAGRLSDAPDLMDTVSLVVNCSSLGMQGYPPLNLDLSLLNKTALVTDLVYTPLHTDLILQAQRQGNPIQTGIGMLLHQARPGFLAWFNKKVEVDEILKKRILGML